MSHVASTPASTTPMTVPAKSPFAAIRRGIPGVIAWLVALLLFFPIFWMTITAFKTEQQAYSSSLFFTPTLDSFREVFARSNYFSFAWNSILISVGVTLLCLILAVPAADAMAVVPTRRTQKGLLWLLSTKRMPSVGGLVPMSLPGLASTALLLVILSWNEAFWSINLSSSNAAPLTVFIASYSSPEGLFWAKLSAASLLAVAPILIVGWLSQKQLVRGLTFGAVK